MRAHRPPRALRPGAAAGRMTLAWAVGVWIVLFILVDTPWLARLELQAADILNQLRGGRPDVGQDIVIVEIDDRSLRAPELQRFPFLRADYARVLDHLKAAGASLIALDILFFEPSANPGDDERLTQAIREAGNVILAGELLTVSREIRGGGDWRTLAVGEAPPGGPPPATGMSLPIAPFFEAARGVGFINVRPDVDHSVRRLPLVHTFEGRLLPSLSLLLAAEYQGLAADDLELGWRDRLVLGDRAYPVNGYGAAVLDFLADPAPKRADLAATIKPASFSRYSFIDVWRGAKGGLPAEAFAGKLVFVGWTASGAMDFYSTPVGGRTPGLELHATGLENLLGGGFLRTASRPLNNLALLLMAVVPALVLSRLRIIWALIAGLVFGIGYLDIVLGLFLNHGLLLDAVAPMMALVFVFAGSAGFRLAGEEQTSHILRRAFEFYVSPDVLTKLARSGENVLSLDHAETREVTVLFADIVGFTAMTERMDPSEVMKLLNEFLTDMSRILLRYEAYIDKYLGDGVMAVFNAFAAVGYPDHPLRAVRCALEMQEVTRRLRDASIKRGEAAFGLRIGINTGLVVAGNLGSEMHAQYSVIGDTVNIASRIEQQCRDFGTDIMIGQKTYDQCSYYLDLGQVVQAQVKGITDALTMYEVRGLQHLDELPVF